MADDSLNGQAVSEMVTMTRVIEYHGPREWVENCISNSRIPLNGIKGFPKISPETYIRGGVIMWMSEEDASQATATPATDTIPFPPRPGGRA